MDANKLLDGVDVLSDVGLAYRLMAGGQLDVQGVIRMGQDLKQDELDACQHHDYAYADDIRRAAARCFSARGIHAILHLAHTLSKSKAVRP